MLGGGKRMALRMTTTQVTKMAKKKIGTAAPLGSSPKRATNIRPKLPLPKELLLHMHSLMLKSRVLEERLIKIYKVGESFFWIGAPGEEAWGVPLGLLTKKGRGPTHDYLHL